jgi:hypothetical protein
MFYKILISSAIALTTALSLTFSHRATAAPADLFQQHLARIQRQMPDRYVVRFPSEILLGGPGLETLDQLIVKVIPTDTPQQVIVNLQTCEAQPYPCLVGSFSFAQSNDPGAAAEFVQHQAIARSVTLTPEITGYLVEGDTLLERMTNPAANTGFSPTEQSFSPASSPATSPASSPATSPATSPETRPQITHYSTVMWQQDGMIYGIRFLNGERQNILYMARSMALQQPIPTIPQSASRPVHP